MITYLQGLSEAGFGVGISTIFDDVIIADLCVMSSIFSSWLVSCDLDLLRHERFDEAVAVFVAAYNKRALVWHDVSWQGN